MNQAIIIWHGKWPVKSKTAICTNKILEIVSSQI